MIMNHRLFIFFLLLTSSSVFAQVGGWERLHRVDNSVEHLVVDGFDYQDGFIRLALTIDEDSTEYQSANLTMFDNKGQNNWSRDIVVGDSLPLYREGDLAILGNENLVIALSGLKDSLSQFLAVTDPTGNLLWSKQYAIYQDSTDFEIAKPRVTQSIVDSLSLFHAGIGLNEGTQQIFVSKVSAETGQTQWANYVNLDGGELVFGDMTPCLDGGVMIVAIDQATQQFVVTKIDEDGNLVLNKAISIDLDPTNSVANSIAQLQDSTFVMIGNYFDQGVEFDGYVVKLDTIADVEWAKRLDIDLSFSNVTLLDVLGSADNNILISGKLVGELDTAAFGMKFDLQGELVWGSKFKTVSLDNIQLGGLGEANDGGLSYFLNGGDDAQPDLAYGITTDADGLTLCNDVLDSIVFDVNFVADTLDLVSSPFIPTYTEFCCEGNSHIGDDRENIVVSVREFGGVDYVLGHNNRDNGSRFGFLSRLAADGTPDWTFEYPTPSRFLEFVQTEDDNLILVGSTEPFDDNSDNRSLIVSVDDNGQLIESREYDFSAREILKNIVVHENPIDPTNPIYISGIANKDSIPSTIDNSIIINMDNQLNINWSQIIDIDSLDTELDRLTFSQDGNLVSAGRVEPDNECFVQIDGLNGSVISSQIAASTSYGRRMVQLADGRFVVTADIDNDNVRLYLLDEDLNFLSGIDFTSNVFEVNSLGVGENNNLFLSLIVDAVPMIGVGSVMSDELVFTEARFFEGDSVFSTLGALEVNGLDMSYVESRIDDNGFLDVFHFNGSITEFLSCTREVPLTTTPISLTLLDTIATSEALTPEFISGSDLTELDWDREDFCENISFAECSDVEMTSEGFGGFNLPVLTLETRPFCANEPLIWTFDAETEGAISYLWENEDGDPIGAADTLTVTEEGMYSVTVTIGEEVCFQLCDSSEIVVLEEPSLVLSQMKDPFCETGEITLSAVPTAEAGLDSLIWSTGEVGTTSITVADPGTYSATLVDNCGITSEASIEADIPVLINSVSIADGFDVFCSTQVYTLTASVLPADATVNGSSWSTGESGFSINITEPGTYTVTVLDCCDNPVQQTITVDFIPITFNDFPLDTIASDCMEDMILLETVPSLPASFTYLWNTDETTPTITVPIEDNSYSVTVTDECNISSVQTTQVSESQCDGAFRWPNAMIPSANIPDTDNLNRVFGPQIVDSEGVTNYDLRIYNRWGEKVFESDDFEERWDGVWNDTEQPGGVYLYIATYDLFGREVLQKGDLTLLR